MYSTKQIIKEAESLPVEERAVIIDRLLRSLNTPSHEIDLIWIDTAKLRLSELRSGKVKSIPGNQVFTKVQKYFDV